MDQIDLSQNRTGPSTGLVEQLNLVGPPAASAFLMAPDQLGDQQQSGMVWSRSSSTDSVKSGGWTSSEQIRTRAWSPATEATCASGSARRSSDEWARTGEPNSANQQGPKLLRQTRRR